MMEALDCLIRDHFFVMTGDSPVSMNLHTGKEIVSFLRKDLQCKDDEARELTDKLLENGNLRPLGILSPTTQLAALKSRHDGSHGASTTHPGNKDTDK